MQQRYDGLVGTVGGARSYTEVQIGAVADMKTIQQSIEKAANEALHATIPTL